MKKKRANIIAYMGIFLGMAIVLNIIENMIPPITALPPGIKLGLSNIVVMYCLFFVGRVPAIGVAVLKAFFVLLTRGFIAGLLSLTGGICSILIMILIMVVFHNKASYLILSVFGGIFHNIGQIAMASIILQTALIAYYLPLLIIGGLIAGILTATLLKIIMPALKKIKI